MRKQLSSCLGVNHMKTAEPPKRDLRRFLFLPVCGEFAFFSIFYVPRPRFWRTMILKYSDGLKSQDHAKAC
jgi:hypothetical protein